MVKSGQCEVLAISLGAAGALVVSEKFSEHILPPTVPIVSKVGAGDSMVAGIALGEWQQLNIRYYSIYENDFRFQVGWVEVRNPAKWALGFVTRNA